MPDGDGVNNWLQSRKSAYLVLPDQIGKHSYLEEHGRPRGCACMRVHVPVYLCVRVCVCMCMYDLRVHACVGARACACTCWGVCVCVYFLGMLSCESYHGSGFAVRRGLLKQALCSHRIAVNMTGISRCQQKVDNLLATSS